MDTNLTQNWLGLAALLVGIGALIYAVWNGKAQVSTDGERQYAEKLERIVERQSHVQRETVEAMRAMTEEMRITRGEQISMHRQNGEDLREVRDALRDVERTIRQ